jgi:hypothetical protein
VEEIGDSGWLAFAKVIPFFEEMERKYNLVELNNGSKTVLYEISLPPRLGCQWSHLPGYPFSEFAGGQSIV